MLLKELQKLGFTKNLATVYTTLFDLGEAKAGNIVRSTGLHRNLVYLALEELEEKKLVSKSQTRGVARFKVLDPVRLLGEVEEKKKLAEDIIEELKSKHKIQSQEIVIYEGQTEMQKKMTNVYESMKIGENMGILGGTSSLWFGTMEEKNINKLLQIQKNNNFFINVVGGKMDENEQRLKKELGGLINYKIIPNISSKTNETIVLKDRVILLIFVEPYTTVEIINPAVVESYKKYFDILWNETTQNLRGGDGVKVFFDEISEVQDVYWIGGSKDGMDKYFPKLAEECKKNRLKKKINWYDLLDPEAELAGVEKGSSLNDEPYYQYKYLSASMSSPHVICLYGNKVANIIWKDGGFINIIENEEIVSGYKKHFDYLWNQEVKTYSGREEVNNLFNKKILDALKTGDTEYVIGAGYGEDGMGDYVTKLFREHNSYLIKNKIHKHVLMYEKHRDKFEKEVKEFGDKKFEYVHTRYLPDTYAFPVETHMYKDMAVITYFGENPVSTVYTHPKIIENYKKQFDLLWSIAKE